MFVFIYIETMKRGREINTLQHKAELQLALLAVLLNILRIIHYINHKNAVFVLLY